MPHHRVPEAPQLFCAVLCLLICTAAEQQAAWEGWGLALLQGRRLEMEDRAAVLVTNCSMQQTGQQQQQQYRMFGVFDGHGGTSVAHALSRQLLPAIGDALCSTSGECTGDNAATASTSAVGTANAVASCVQPSQVLQLLTDQFAAVDVALLHGALQPGLQVPSSPQEQPNLQPESSQPPPVASSIPAGDVGSTAVVLLLTQEMQAGDAGSGGAGKAGTCASSCTSSGSGGGTAPAGGEAAPAPSAALWGIYIASVGNSRAVLCRKGGPGTSAGAGSQHQPAAEDADAITGSSSSSSSRARVLRHHQQYQQHSSLRRHRQQAAAGLREAAAVGCGREGPWVAVPLTPLHEAGNVSEAARVQAAGGTILPAGEGGIPRLAGELELTRAFGDAAYRAQGLTAVPHVAFHPLAPGDQVVVLASDGLFEVLGPQRVCDHAAAQLLGLTHPARTPHAPLPIQLGGSVAGTGGEEAENEPASGSRGQCGEEEQGLQQDGGCSYSSSYTSGSSSSGNADMQAVAARLVQEAYDLGSGDNLAVMAIDLRDLAPAAAQPAAAGAMEAPAAATAAATASLAQLGRHEHEHQGQQQQRLGWNSSGADPAMLPAGVAQCTPQELCAWRFAAASQPTEGAPDSALLLPAVAAGPAGMPYHAPAASAVPPGASDDSAAEKCLPLRECVLLAPEQQGEVGADGHATGSIDGAGSLQLVVQEPQHDPYTDATGDADADADDLVTGSWVRHVVVVRAQRMVCRLWRVLQRAWSTARRAVRAAWPRRPAGSLLLPAQQVEPHMLDAGGAGVGAAADGDAAAAQPGTGLVPLSAGMVLDCPADTPHDGPAGGARAVPEQAAAAGGGAAEGVCEGGLQRSKYQLEGLLLHTPRPVLEEHCHWYTSLQQNGAPGLLQLRGLQPLLPLPAGNSADMPLQQGTATAASAGEPGQEDAEGAAAWGVHFTHGALGHAEGHEEYPYPYAYDEDGEEAVVLLQDASVDKQGPASSYDSYVPAAEEPQEVQLVGQGGMELQDDTPPEATVEASAPAGLGTSSDAGAQSTGVQPPAGQPLCSGHMRPSTHAAAPPLSSPSPAQLEEAAGSLQVGGGARTGRALLMARDIPLPAGACEGDQAAVSSSSQHGTFQPSQVVQGVPLVPATPAAPDLHSHPGPGQQPLQVAAAPPRYQLDRRFGAGHFGEVWHASIVRGPQPHHHAQQRHQHRRHDGADDASTSSSGSTAGGDVGQAGEVGGAGEEAAARLVLKRVFAERGAALYEAGLREAYFGQLLARHLQQQQQQQSTRGASQLAPHPGFAHTVRFVEAFYTPRQAAHATPHASDTVPRSPRTRRITATQPPHGPAGRDLWLVFHHAGTSLHDLMYEPMQPPGAGADRHAAAGADGPASTGEGGPDNDATSNPSAPPGGADAGSSSADAQGLGPGPGGFQLLGPSRWWWGMRHASRDGDGPMREVLRQLLTALDALQGLNITHRDIKTDNLMLAPQAPAGPKHVPAGGCQGRDCQQLTAAGPFAWSGQEHLTLIDFGSALDSHTLSAGMWGAQGPGAAQTTAEYAPPEALFARYWEGTRAVRPRMWAYDMWSVGVVWLEMLLGTPDVWALPAATRALLDARLTAAGRPLGERATAYLLHGLQQWCIHPPGGGSSAAGAARQRAAHAQPQAASGRGSSPTQQEQHQGQQQQQQQGCASDSYTAQRMSIPQGVQAPGRAGMVLVPGRAAGAAGTIGSAAQLEDVSPAASTTASSSAGSSSSSSSGSGPHSAASPVVSWACTDGAIQELLKARDPTQLGLGSNLAAVSLLRSLLAWSPAQRPTARQALDHPYFSD